MASSIHVYTVRVTLSKSTRALPQFRWTANFGGTLLYYFTPLLTSSLRSISIYDPSSSHTGEMAACLILDTLIFRNAKMTYISY